MVIVIIWRWDDEGGLNWSHGSVDGDAGKVMVAQDPNTDGFHMSGSIEGDKKWAWDWTVLWEPRKEVLAGGRRITNPWLELSGF